ncbi:MAG: hypothetical protein HPY73_05790 [Methanomassiliicoccales archaeon]|nr:MAG: hypothetical protein HPY73_05790 [Methanomassiliicoccales archaeon]
MSNAARQGYGCVDPGYFQGIPATLRPLIDPSYGEPKRPIARCVVCGAKMRANDREMPICSSYCQHQWEAMHKGRVGGGK